MHKYQYDDAYYMIEKDILNFNNIEDEEAYAIHLNYGKQ